MLYATSSALRRIVAAAVLAGGTTAALAAPGWTITDLGSLPGGTTSTGYAINNNGWITGEAATQPANSGLHSFLYDGTSTRDLGPAGVVSAGKAINASGVVAGSAYLTAGVNRAVRYGLDGSVTDLGTLRSNNSGQSVALGINDAGVIVGQSYYNTGTSYHGVIWDDGTKTDIGTFGGTQSWARDINNAGQVTGGAQRAGNVTRAFIYEDGALTDIGAFTANGYSYGTAINDSGWVTGNAQAADGSFQAFLYREGQFLNIALAGAATSSGYAINSLGYVVGYYKTSTAQTAPSTAFLYANGETIALNSLLAPDSGWDLREAWGINDRGDIAGYGIYTDLDGNRYGRAFLLAAPVPEASTWAMMLAGLGVLGAAAGRRRGRQREAA